MSRRIALAGWFLKAALTVCAMTLMAPAARADTLNINYNSGSEKKLVITGPLLTADQERVFTESELKQLFAKDTYSGDLYYFTMNNTVLSKRAYTVRGVSLWDVFDYSGIPESIYRNPRYYLHAVSTDGFFQTIGPGVEFQGQGGITETGTLSLPRYSHYTAGPQGQMAVTYEFTEEIDSGGGVEVPWVIAFAEDFHSVFDGPTGVVGNPFFPGDATRTDQILRPFFGQAYVTNQNLPLSVNGTYRMVFARARLYEGDVHNVPSAQVFSINGTMVDRAYVLTGSRDPSGLGGTYGEKVKGSYSGSEGFLYFEGADVLSLVNAGSELAWVDNHWVETPNHLVGPGGYAFFENAAGENLVVSYEEIQSKNYTLVYRTGRMANDMSAIERKIGGKTYFFDLYRDGAPVVQNISGIFSAEEPGPVVLDRIEVTKKPDKTDYNAGERLNLAGLEITGRYSDGSSETISGYTVSPANGAVLNSPGETKVTVTYGKGDERKTASFPVTVKLASTAFIVTFNYNYENSPANTTLPTGTDGRLSSLPAPSRSGYAFLGWFTAGSGGAQVAGDTVFTGNTAVYAQWAPVGGGNAPQEDGGLLARLDYTQSGGAVTLSLTDGMLSDLVSKAKGGTALLDLSGASGATEAVIPAAVFRHLAKAGLQVEIRLPLGAVAFDAGAAKDLAEQAEGDERSLAIAAARRGDLTEAQREMLKPNDQVFVVAVFSGGREMTGFNGKLRISFPYSGPRPAAVWYIDAEGASEKLASHYDAEAKTIRFTTSSLSLFRVGFDADAPFVSPFADVGEGDWFYEDVKYVYSMGWMAGQAADSFAPDVPLTRGMAATVLYRLAGSPDTSGWENPFLDVAEDSWYAGAIIWASNNGLLNGYGGGLAGPADHIKREDLVILLLRYADFSGLKLLYVRSYTGFSDESGIAAYARPMVERGYRLGVIGGKGGNRIDAGGQATRAEFAATLHRLMEPVKPIQQ